MVAEVGESEVGQREDKPALRHAVRIETVGMDGRFGDGVLGGHFDQFYVVRDGEPIVLQDVFEKIHRHLTSLLYAEGQGRRKSFAAVFTLFLVCFRLTPPKQK